MEKIEVQIVALNSSESSPGNYVVVLETVISKEKIAIIIGAFEAQSIAVHIERMQLLRPLTHTIFKTVIESLGASLKEIIIYDLIDNIFYASLILITENKEEKKIDVRTSDAIALAIRFDCPIYINDFVLKEVKITETTTKLVEIKGSLALYTLEELNSLLQDVLAKEDYESATRIRDIINKSFLL